MRLQVVPPRASVLAVRAAVICMGPRQYHHRAYTPEELTFAMDVPSFDMPVEPLLPSERYKWPQTLCSGKKLFECTYIRCTPPKCTQNTQELLSASAADVRSDSEAKRHCDLGRWKYDERGCYSVVATDWRESGLGRSPSA
jgi:hypothetical protein